MIYTIQRRRETIAKKLIQQIPTQFDKPKSRVFGLFPGHETPYFVCVYTIHGTGMLFRLEAISSNTCIVLRSISMHASHIVAYC